MNQKVNTHIHVRLKNIISNILIRLIWFLIAKMSVV